MKVNGELSNTISTLTAASRVDSRLKVPVLMFLHVTKPNCSSVSCTTYLCDKILLPSCVKMGEKYEKVWDNSCKHQIRGRFVAAQFGSCPYKVACKITLSGFTGTIFKFLSKFDNIGLSLISEMITHWNKYVIFKSNSIFAPVSQFWHAQFCFSVPS